MNENPVIVKTLVSTPATEKNPDLSVNFNCNAKNMVMPGLSNASVIFVCPVVAGGCNAQLTFTKQQTSGAFFMSIKYVIALAFIFVAALAL